MPENLVCMRRPMHVRVCIYCICWHLLSSPIMHLMDANDKVFPRARSSVADRPNLFIATHLITEFLYTFPLFQSALTSTSPFRQSTITKRREKTVPKLFHVNEWDACLFALIIKVRQPKQIYKNREAKWHWSNSISGYFPLRFFFDKKNRQRLS